MSVVCVEDEGVSLEDEASSNMDSERLRSNFLKKIRFGTTWPFTAALTEPHCR